MKSYLEKLKKYQMVIFLSFLVVILSIVRFSYSGENNYEANISKSPTPTEVLSPVPSEKPVPEEIVENEKEVDGDYPLWEQLPYKGKGFVAEKYTAPLTLLITPKGLDKKLVNKEIIKWLESNNLKADSHRIVWSDEKE